MECDERFFSAWSVSHHARRSPGLSITETTRTKVANARMRNAGAYAGRKRRQQAVKNGGFRAATPGSPRSVLYWKREADGGALQQNLSPAIPESRSCRGTRTTLSRTAFQICSATFPSAKRCCKRTSPRRRASQLAADLAARAAERACVQDDNDDCSVRASSQHLR